MKILVADDSRVMRKIVVRTLRQAGYAGHAVLEAADGDEALELIFAEKPDLVLSDWNMPGISGLDLLLRLRGAGNPVTFGFVTSEGSVEMRLRAHDAGAHFVIGKPFDADDFREVLAPVLPAEAPRRVPTSLPAPKAVRDMFETLLGRDVVVAPCEPVEVGPLDPAQVAVYVDDALRMSAVVVTDLDLAARCGAALGLAPAAGVDDVLTIRQLPEALRANMDEVLNITATLFNLPGTPHVRLHRTFAPGEALAADVNLVAHALGRRLDLAVDIAGYGQGRLSFVLNP